MAALTSNETEKIRLEEVYRAEVRRQLEDGSRVRSRLLQFLNSSFGLWLLSAVFISGVGAVYQRCEKNRENESATFQQNLKEDSERRQLIIRLDDEISYRLSKSLIDLSAVAQDQLSARPSDGGGAREKPPAAGDGDGTGPADIVARLAAPPRNADGTLYPEFSTYSLPTLLVLLRRSLSNESEREGIESSLAALAAMSREVQTAGLTARATASRVLGDVVLPRWQGTSFYYIDCSSKEPFC